MTPQLHPRTRIAPTPSGFLHAGNIFNFERTAALAHDVGADIALRIDDMDATRYRPEYVDDIFRVLDDLGINWTTGPRDRRDFEANFSLGHKVSYYFEHIEQLRDGGIEVYACECSRKDFADNNGRCPRACRTRNLDYTINSHALRVHIPQGISVTIDNIDVDLATEVGDFVVWRRDGLPAYHLASVIEDRDMGITHIVRGTDLLLSTAAQLFIAPSLKAENFMNATFIHHPLILDEDGNKLSKSTAGTR